MLNRPNLLVAFSLTLFLLAGGFGITCARGEDNGGRLLTKEEQKAKEEQEAKEEQKEAEMAAARDLVQWQGFPSRKGLLKLRVLPLSIYGESTALFDIAKISDLKIAQREVLEWDWSPNSADINVFRNGSAGQVLLIKGEFDLLTLKKYPGLEFESTSPEDFAIYMEESFRPFEQESMRFQIFLIAEFLNLNLQFPGGDFADWKAALQVSINTACERQMPEMLKSMMPKMINIPLETEFSDADPRVAAMKIKGASLASQPWLGKIITLSTDEEPTGSVVSKRGVYSVRPVFKNQLILTAQNQEKRVIRPGEAEVDVYKGRAAARYLNLATMITPTKGDSPSAADVATLLEIRWNMNAPFVWATTRFHPGTNMLIVSGSSDEINIANEVFSALTGKTDSSPAAGTRPAARP